MKIPAKFVLIAVLALAGIVLTSEPAQAQTCSISSTFTVVNTASTACFTAKGNSIRVTISGTWAGSVQFQTSRDGGVQYFPTDNFTSNATFTTDPAPQDVRYRLFITAYTSGTVSYTINDVTYSLGRLRHEVVEIGPVAYASLGTSTTATSTTSVYVSDVLVPTPFKATGIGILVGSATAATVIVALYDSSGLLVANSSLSGTAQTGAAANTFAETPFTSTVNLQPGVYYIGYQQSATTGTCKMIAASTYGRVRTKEVTGNAYGTALASFVPPTTFTALVGCHGYIY